MNRLAFRNKTLNDIKPLMGEFQKELTTPLVRVRIGRVIGVIVTILFCLAILLVLGLAVSMLIAVIQTAIEAIPWIANHVPQWLFIAVVFAAATGLYLVRCRARAVYGIVVGMATACRAVTFDLQKADIGTLLQILGGLYVVVRGLDNIGKWIDRTGRFKELWSKIFGNHFT